LTPHGIYRRAGPVWNPSVVRRLCEADNEAKRAKNGRDNCSPVIVVVPAVQPRAGPEA